MAKKLSEVFTIPLDDAKLYLKIDYDDIDQTILDSIDTAIEMVDEYLGRDYEIHSVPAATKTACMKIVSSLIENPESGVVYERLDSHIKRYQNPNPFTDVQIPLDWRELLWNKRINPGL